MAGTYGTVSGGLFPIIQKLKADFIEHITLNQTLLAVLIIINTRCRKTGSTNSSHNFMDSVHWIQYQPTFQDDFGDIDFLNGVCGEFDFVNT